MLTWECFGYTGERSLKPVVGLRWTVTIRLRCHILLHVRPLLDTVQSAECLQCSLAGQRLAWGFESSESQ